MEESSSSFWHNFSKSLIPSSSNFTRHCSSPDRTRDETFPNNPSKEVAQEEPAGKTARSCSLTVKPPNSVVSEILKSLTNINKDYKNMVMLSSISPIGEQLKIPLFKGNALMIYNNQVYLPCGMRHSWPPYLA